MAVFETLSKYWGRIISPAILTTITIVFFVVLISFVLGFLLAMLLTIYGPNGLHHKKTFYNVLSFIINMVRSFPILILIVAIAPVTRSLIGTTLGVKAAIFPLAIAATAVTARLLETQFISVDKQLIDAARSLGATDMQIFFRVIIKETLPTMIPVIALVTINNIAASTIAGTVGGGGVGAIALTYGYQSFNDVIMYTCVFILLIMVNFVQYFGDWLFKKIK